MFFSLLTACPKHHHHHGDCNPIKTIHSFKEVDFDQIDANTLVIFDVDDVLIFCFAHKGTVRERLFKELKQRISKKELDLLCGIIYEKRPPVLVEPIIVGIMKKLKLRNIPTIALSALETGKQSGLSLLREDWRIHDLEKAGIVFNDPFKKTLVFDQLKGKPMLKNGIIFTSEHDKGELLKKVFSKTGCNFNKIMFFDDKESHVTSVAKAAEDLGIAYKGYIYKGAESMPKPALDKDAEEYRFSVLEKDHIWLDEKEARQRLSVAS